MVPERGSPTTMIGLRDGDLENLGVPGQEVVNAQAVGRGSDAVAEHHEPADAGAFLVGVHLGQLQPEAHGEVLVPEVAQACPLRGAASHTASTVSSVVFDSP